MLKNLIILPVFCALFAACGSDTSNPPAPQSDLKPIGEIQGSVSEIIVSDANGNPIANASVMIGTAPNRPFANNVVVTDKSGTFKPMRDWSTVLPVTITAQGFVRTTYMNQLPLQKSFVVRAKSPVAKPELNGITTGFGALVKDGFVDVGIVIPALTRADLANFQASTLLSPETDLISLPAGQKAYLPSNITLPLQSESVFPVTVKLDKPNYRMFVERKASYKVVSAHVKFPLKKVIQDSQDGKNGIDLVNHFTFLEAGVSSTVIASDKQTLNLPVNQIQFNSTVTAQAPLVRATQSILAVALVKDGEQLYPTDIKTLVSKETRKLSFPTGASGFVLGVLQEQAKASRGAESDFMSVHLKSSMSVNALEFLPLIEAPKVSSGTLVLRPPTMLAGLKGIATTATLSSIELKTVGKNSYEIKRPEWDIYAPEWVTEITLPMMPPELGTNMSQAPSRMRWEAVFMAAPQNSTSSELGPDVMNSATHLTRSAVDL